MFPSLSSMALRARDFRRTGRWAALVASVALLAGLASAPALAGADTCRSWRAEHAELKSTVLGLHLRGASQARVDAAMFELLQREAYLTSCGVTAQQSRSELVGWRLVERTRGEYASAVVESVLEMAGFDVDLSRRLGVSSGYAPRLAERAGW